MKYKINLIIQKKIPSKNILLKWINWLNNSRVSKFSSRSFIKHTITSQKKFVKQRITDKNCKLFLIKYLNLYIGVIELTNIEYKNKNCEIRYLIGNPSLWGKGLASESIKLASKYAFKRLKIKTIYADTHQDNLASQKVLKKNNFKIQGRIKKFFSGKAKARDKIIFVKNKK